MPHRSIGARARRVALVAAAVLVAVPALALILLAPAPGAGRTRAARPELTRPRDSGARAASAYARPPTIPALREWTGARGSFRLTAASRIVVPASLRGRLEPIARTLAGDLRQLTGHGLGVESGAALAPRAGDIELRLKAADRQLGGEGYELDVGRTVVISAPTTSGVFYGTRTLLQLARGGHAIPRGRARDWPRYPERGLMIDLGRRVYPASWIEAEIRRMAYLKLNTLHLHLTDDGRWGIASDTHPELASAGALTKQQIREIIARAAQYRVKVVPEIDMPGHMGALLARHRRLELQPTAAGVAPPPPQSGKLDITSPAALALVRQLLVEYLPLFPGRYWDMGGDEYLSPADVPSYPQLAKYAISQYGPGATSKDAIVGFVNWVDRLVRDHGKTLRAWHDELGPGNVLRTNADVVADWWINVSVLSDLSPPTPQQLLAGGHVIANDGWFPTYDTGDVGRVQGMPSMRKAYESWEVNQFCGPTINDAVIAPCYVVGAGEPRNLGASINVWGNNDRSLTQIAAGLSARLRVLAQKTWDSPELTASYAGFEQIMRAVGR